MEEGDTLRVAKEDILRTLVEQTDYKGSLDFLSSELMESRSALSTAVGELHKENLIQVGKESIALTEEGQHAAATILQKHLAVERYLKKTRNEVEAHEGAHILEHHISEEVIDNLARLSALKTRGIPLTRFQFGEEGIVSNLVVDDSILFARLVSMGIAPGERIMMTHKVGHTIVASVTTSVALDEDIARRIEVLHYEST